MKLEFPTFVGVPEIVPDDRSSTRPGGSTPDAIRQAYGSAPPDAWSVVLYGVLRRPAGRFVVVMVSGVTDVGVTLLEGADSGPLRTAFVAWTVNVYAVPFVSPVTTIGLPAPDAVKAPGVDVTVYEVIGLPPLDAGGLKLTVAWPLPAVAVAAVGAPGAVATGALQFANRNEPILVLQFPSRSRRSSSPSRVRRLHPAPTGPPDLMPRRRDGRQVELLLLLLVLGVDQRCRRHARERCGDISVGCRPDDQLGSVGTFLGHVARWSGRA